MATQYPPSTCEWGQPSNSKIEGVLAVGSTVWQLVTGQLGLEAIGRMAWEAVKALIPPTLIRILIEKLVSLVVPAAGALLVIVEGLQAAWGTISRLIASIDLFITFLKSVKGGGAGPQFAAALASAGIVVLDFVANFLLAKLGSGLKALGGKLRGIAQRLSKKAKAKGRGKRRGAAGRRRPPRTRRPAVGARRRRRARSKGEEKKKKDEASSIRRIDQALVVARERFAAGIPEKRADDVVRRIARRFKVSPVIRAGATSWTIGFRGSPEKTAQVPTTDPAKEAAACLERTVSADKAAENAMRDEQRAVASARAESGAARAVEQTPQQLTGKAAAEKGQKFEVEAEEELQRLEKGESEAILPPGIDQKLEALLRSDQGGLVVPRVGGTGGFDTVIIRGDEVIIVETKAGRPTAFGVMEEGRSEKEMERAQEAGRPIRRLDKGTVFKAIREKSQDVIRGVLGAEEESATLFQQGPKGRAVENKVSAITTNLVQNLTSLKNHLERCLALAKTAAAQTNSFTQVNQLERAIATVTSVLDGTGKLQILLVSGAAPPSAGQLGVIETLVNAAAGRLNTVNPIPIRTALLKDGKIVGGHK